MTKRQRKAIVRQFKASRAFYGFEDVLWKMPAFASMRRRRSIAQLQLLAGLVWAREGGADGKCPAVRPIDGPVSYFYDGAIYLTGCSRATQQNHRNVGSLLHELAHALGTHDKLHHGPAFTKRCLHLFKEYGGWNGEVAL